MDILARIKRCVLLQQVRFTYKAESERVADDLTELEVFESIVNATKIDKTLNSTSVRRGSKRERLYVIRSPTVRGVWIYTKGKFSTERGVETYYLLISAKKPTKP